MPRSEGNTKRLTKAAKKRHNKATMHRRQESDRGRGSGRRGGSGNS